MCAETSGGAFLNGDQYFVVHGQLPDQIDIKRFGKARIGDGCGQAVLGQFVGGLYDPMEGHVDPSGVTNAYARGATLKGAEIYRQTRVLGLSQRPDGIWEIDTEKGTIAAEHVVNAGGLWAREVGRMVGLELPVLAMEHQYLITEDMPEVIEANAATGKEVPHCIDFEGELYLRQEGRGMLMGPYERHGRPWSEETTPWDFDMALLPNDLVDDLSFSKYSSAFLSFPTCLKGIKINDYLKDH